MTCFQKIKMLQWLQWLQWLFIFRLGSPKLARCVGGVRYLGQSPKKKLFFWCLPLDTLLSLKSVSYDNKKVKEEEIIFIGKKHIFYACYFFSEVQKVSSQIQKLFRTVWHMSKAGQFSLNYVNILRIMWKLFFTSIQQYYIVFLLSISFYILSWQRGFEKVLFKLLEFSKYSLSWICWYPELILPCTMCQKRARSIEWMSLYPILFIEQLFFILQLYWRSKPGRPT